ncbi:energy transducer TonB [Halomonas sp. LBP4]|uniref:energy transducer TonB n=1 Tax=Halomonas sp. LBP4 TaxID=2044917 RepID=UPI000D76C4D5|nr:energy transducer TonB [Halomonas sp. LBP4]PXX99471.1 iron transporter [Halomonas sp. LBP4]
MIRGPVSALAGMLMALVLFWLLALVVLPPEEEFEELEEPITLRSVEMPEVQEEVAEPPPQAAPPPPEVAPPPPLPEPAPPMESPIALPEPEVVEPLEVETTLPELSEAVPEPVPTPEPRPEPAPPREPSPQPSPATEASSAASAETSAETVARTPVEVGQVTPTSQVPPEYPRPAVLRGQEGYVELEFVIRTDGSVDPSSIRVTSAHPSNVFDDAARKAVARWRFSPAERLRRARQRLEFELR